MVRGLLEPFNGFCEIALQPGTVGARALEASLPRRYADRPRDVIVPAPYAQHDFLVLRRSHRLDNPAHPELASVFAVYIDNVIGGLQSGRLCWAAAHHVLNLDALC